MALQRFHALERKFAKNPALKEKYSEFIQENLNLGPIFPCPQRDTMIFSITASFCLTMLL